MWNRKDLKTKGKQSFLSNYWKSVIAALILAIALGASFKLNYTFNDSDTNATTNEFTTESFLTDEDRSDLEDTLTIIEKKLPGDADLQVVTDTFSKSIDELSPYLWIIGLIGSIIAAAGIAIKVFLLNPLEVGGRSFFVKNLNEKAELKEVLGGFKENYLGNAKTMFFKDLYTILWTLLLIVPGIIKTYEYRMIPYLVKAHPEMTTKEIFQKSKEMMNGNKWDAFVLDLSFIGWHLLNAVLFGIPGIFFVRPYQYSTNAALYETLHGTSNTVTDSEYYVEVQ